MAKKSFCFFSIFIGLMGFLAGCKPADTTPFFPALDQPFLSVSLAMFEDNFNDNDINVPTPAWWAGSYAMGYFDTICDAVGECWLRFDGPELGWSGDNHDTGLYHRLGEGHVGIRPTYISFNIFSWSGPGRIAGNFRLDGRIHPELSESYLPVIDFYVLGEQMVVNGSAFLLDQVNWESHWFQVEYKNIQWESSPPRFDFYVDGALVGNCLSFLNAVGSFESFDLYNYETGYVGWDNFYMGWGAGEDAAQAPACGAPPPVIPSRTPSPSASSTPTVTVTLTSTATPAPPKVVCEGLEYSQCIKYPECEWIESTKRGGTSYCANR